MSFRQDLYGHGAQVVTLRCFDGREATLDSSPGIHAGDLAVSSSEAPKVATQRSIYKLCRRLRGLKRFTSQFPGLKPRAISHRPSGTKSAQLQKCATRCGIIRLHVVLVVGCEQDRRS